MTKKNIIIFITTITIILSIILCFGIKSYKKNKNKPPLLINVCKNNKWGYINKENKVVIPFVYDLSTMFFENDRAVVEKKNLYGVIDRNNKVVIPIEYKRINDYSEGVASAQRKKFWGFFDGDGNTVVPFQYEYAESFSDGLAAVKKDGKFGFINKDDEMVISNEYKAVKSFNKGVAAVSLDGEKWGVINKKGKIILPFEYDAIEEYNNKEFTVCNSDKNEFLKCGIVNKKNKPIIPLNYYGINPQKEGLYAVQVTAMGWAYMDRSKKPFGKTYYNAYSFDDGLAIACTEFEKCGFINKKGDFVISPEYRVISPFVEGLSAVMKNNKWGFVDKTGNVIIPFEYDWTGFIF